MINSTISSSNAAALLSLYGSPDTSLPGAASGQVGSMSNDQINKVSKDFESMFVSQMLEQMFGDSQGDAAFGSSETNDVYKGLMMDQYGKQIAMAGGIGIADYVKKELLKLQEK